MPDDIKKPRRFRSDGTLIDEGAEIVVPKDSTETQVPSRIPRRFKSDGSPVFLGQELVPPTVGTDVSKPVPQGDLKDPTPFIRRMLPGLLPAGGALLGGLVNPLLSGVGAAAGSQLSQGIREKMPGVFGDSGPSSGLDSAIETGVDVLGQTVIPEALKKLLTSGIRKTLAETVAGTWLRKFPGVKEGVGKELASQVPKPYPESLILETMGENAVDTKRGISSKIFNARQANNLTAAAQAALEDMEIFGGNKVGNKLLKLGGESQLPANVAREQAYKEISNLTYSDLIHVRNAKLATGDIMGVEQMGMNRLLSKGASAESRINPKAILDELNGPKGEIYREGIRPMTVTNLTKMMEEIQAQEIGSTTNRVINYSKGRLGVALAGGALFGGAISKGAATVYLTNAALTKFASNPQNAKLIIQAMRTGSSSPQASLLQEAIVNGLRGTEVILMTPDGKENKVTIPAGETEK